jgi:hypothetical protein
LSQSASFFFFFFLNPHPPMLHRLYGFLKFVMFKLVLDWGCGRGLV